MALLAPPVLQAALVSLVVGAVLAHRVPPVLLVLPAQAVAGQEGLPARLGRKVQPVLHTQALLELLDLRGLEVQQELQATPGLREREELDQQGLVDQQG